MTLIRTILQYPQLQSDRRIVFNKRWKSPFFSVRDLFGPKRARGSAVLFVERGLIFNVWWVSLLATVILYVKSSRACLVQTGKRYRRFP